MRRLLRYAINTLTALSLLLCVAACVLLVRGYWVHDHLYYGALRAADGLTLDRVHIAVVSGRGRLFVNVQRIVEFSSTQAEFDSSLEEHAQRFGLRWQRRGISVPATFLHPFTLGTIDSRRAPSANSGWEAGVIASVPSWSLVAAAAVLPAVRLRRAVRRVRRKAAGLCPHCGYDLRATPGRCPECGTEAPARIPD